MKYYLFANSDEVDFNTACEYLVKTDKYKNYAIFEINDDNYKDFYVKSKLSRFLVDPSVSIQVYGDDKAIYSFSYNSINKIFDKSTKSKNAIWNYIKIKSAMLEKEHKFKNRIINSANNGIYEYKSTLSCFKKYVYVNKSSGKVIPFRMKISKNSNQPLVIYHGGAGTIGFDNFKTIFEFFNAAGGKKILDKNCNIIIPQWMNIFGIEDELLDEFANNCNELINSVTKDHKIDKNRIYVYGISHGAMITWKSTIKNPSLYAASVPAMGKVYNFKNTDFNTLKDAHIWIAHSSDDLAVSIDSDDYCYQKLISLGYDVKFTRWDKYGHNMAMKFFKQEPWAEWMFSKSK